MTDIKERIAAFSALGKKIENLEAEHLEALFIKARADNSWFTPESIKTALNGLSNYLQKDKLEAWVKPYNLKNQQVRVGIVMAGNIPLVGFHDLLSVLISGNEAHVKLSSQDTALMTFIIAELTAISPQLANAIKIKERLKEIDAIIATGSDNTSRYFEYYFAKYPHIIRKNRTSCAIITGNESPSDLKKLGEDVFLYYGLGCRNVSKLYVPEGYKFDTFYESIEHYKDITHHHKYANNYDYNKSIYLVNSVPHLDNGFLLLKEDKTMVSPISVLFYERYKDQDNLAALLEKNKDKIQCIVSGNDWPESKALGQAQYPELWDYADGVDTMAFLTETLS